MEVTIEVDVVTDVLMLVFVEVIVLEQTLCVWIRADVV